MHFSRLWSPAGRAPLALAALPVVLALALAGCGGDDESAAPDEPSDVSGTAGLVSLESASPLTGDPLEPPDHPVYVVKIDNTEASAPQVGLSHADLVVEELVEGGLTRLAVFFYSDIPDAVGPVRSMRASDIGITEPVAGNLVASGASRGTTKVLDNAQVPYVRESMGGHGFFRDDTRYAPYNLFNHLDQLAADPGADWVAPERPYLDFGAAGDLPGGRTVGSVDASFSASHTTSWQLGDKGWTRPDSNAERGDDFAPDTLLLLQVRTRDAGYHDAAGSAVPETILWGKGRGVLVHGDQAVTVLWSKEDAASTLRLRTPAGDEVAVPEGHTWIELVPVDGGSIRLGR